MNYIGNEAEWITDDLLTMLADNIGSPVPIWSSERWHGHPLMDEVRKLGENYFGDNIPNQFFHVFNSRTDSFLNYSFNLPTLITPQKNIIWWFVKLNPGELQLMHYDMHLLGVSHEKNDFKIVTDVKKLINAKRYTMYLQDYEPGHAFIYGDKMNVNYKKGDIYEWSDPEIFHGVVNISFNTRYTLQLTLYDDAI